MEFTLSDFVTVVIPVIAIIAILVSVYSDPQDCTPPADLPVEEVYELLDLDDLKDANGSESVKFDGEGKWRDLRLVKLDDEDDCGSR